MEQAVLEYLCANNWNDQLKMQFSGHSVRYLAVTHKKGALAFAFVWDVTPQRWDVWNTRHSALNRINRHPDDTWTLTR